MVSLFKLLIVDDDGKSEKLTRLKKLVYQNVYMDNCSFGVDSVEELVESFHSLSEIFQPYHFPLQQFYTNDVNLQGEIDQGQEAPTPAQVKLLGLEWDRENDTLSCVKVSLNEKLKQNDLFSVHMPQISTHSIFVGLFSIVVDCSYTNYNVTEL